MEEGTQKNPITVLEDEQQQRINQQRVEYETNKQSLYRAHMGSQFDVLVEVIKVEMRGTPQEKNKLLMNRLAKFFSAGIKTINIPNGECFRKKREPNYQTEGVVPVSKELILYGVDFLSTRQVKKKFVGINVKVIWLDDSHCKVIFENGNDAKKGLEMNLLSKSEGVVKLQNEEFEVPKGWFQLQPYNYLTYERRLYGRYATSNENDVQIARSNEYYTYQDAKKKFQQSIRKEVTEIRYLETMKKFGLIDDHTSRERLNRRRDNQNRQRGDRKKWSNNSRRWEGDQEGMRNRTNNTNTNNQGQREQNQSRQMNKRRYGNSQNLNVNEERFERSRNKPNNCPNQFDNLSIASNGSKQSIKPVIERKKSLSIQLNGNEEEREEMQESLSFILNQSQIQSSQQITRKFGNLSFDNHKELQNFHGKEEEIPEKDNNLSFEINQSKQLDKKKIQLKDQVDGNGHRRKPKKVFVNNQSMSKSNKSMSLVIMADEF